MKTRKELKAVYKEKKNIIGVFQIKNCANNKVLIEASTNIESKWNRHRTELRFGSHRNKELQYDWNNLGEANFTFSVISELEFKEEESIDLNEEVKVLKEMILEEMGVKEEMKY